MAYVKPWHTNALHRTFAKIFEVSGSNVVEDDSNTTTKQTPIWCGKVALQQSSTSQRPTDNGGQIQPLRSHYIHVPYSALTPSQARKGAVYVDADCKLFEVVDCQNVGGQKLIWEISLNEGGR